MTRTKLYALIRAGMLPGELISGIFYVSIANTKAIDAALSYKSRNQGHWARGGTSVFKSKRNLNTIDSVFDTAWEQYQKENP